MAKLERLRQRIGDHLADIAEFLDPAYKLTFVARLNDEHTKTIIVGDDPDFSKVARELMSTDNLIEVKAE